MMHLTRSIAAQGAALMALAGGATAQAMSQWGGSLAAYLPPLPLLTLVAALGAGVAGLLLSTAFGRGGWEDVWLSTIMWPVVTALGAVCAATAFGLVEAVTSTRGLHVLEEIAPLGLWGVADGIATSLPVALTWLAGRVAVHLALREERRAAI